MTAHWLTRCCDVLFVLRQLLDEIEGILAASGPPAPRQRSHPAPPSPSRSRADEAPEDKAPSHPASRYPPNYDPTYLASLQTKPYRTTAVPSRDNATRKKKRSTAAGEGGRRLRGGPNTKGSARVGAAGPSGAMRAAGAAMPMAKPK